MKKTLFTLNLSLLVMLSLLIITSSCKKDDDEEETTTTTTSNPNPTAATWNLDVSVDLGGVFPVVATAQTTTNGATFSSNVTTSQIAGAAEVHNATVTGTVSGNTYTVTNASFTIAIDATTNETVTITTATININNNNITGNGNISVLQDGSANPYLGTFTLTGTVQ